MKTSKREFILNTLLHYKQDKSLCGWDSQVQNCVYLASNGNKCAVGMHLKEGVWQDCGEEVRRLDDVYGLNTILTEEALSQNLSLKEWGLMQEYHDNIASSNTIPIINERLVRLERLTKLKFPELLF